MFGLDALGGHVRGLRREKVTDSPHFNGLRFRNPVPTPTGRPSFDLVKDFVTERRRIPERVHPIVRADPNIMQGGKGEDLRVTWLGHSSMVIEVDGVLVLTDPVLSGRCSPLPWAGPKRFHPAPILARDLPEIDVVLISHDHYDHLDLETVLALRKRLVKWVCPLGVGAHLEAWGVPEDRIVELDWWEHVEVRGIEITATPARHFQGRGVGASLATFWASWAIRGPKHSVWFSGDTGSWDEGFEEIGERFGGFDLSLIEIGAWHPAWGSIHLGPTNAARVHQQVRAKTMMPVHWGTFSLALHAWDEPISELLRIAERDDLQILSPMMGETVHRESGVADYWRDRS